MSNSFFKVSKEFVSTTQGPKRWRLKVWVQETTNNIPGEIFVYQMYPGVPLYKEGKENAIFVNIASYQELIAFPKDYPSVENPFFRKHYIDIVHTSRSFLEDTWKLMEQQITILIADITRLNNIPPTNLEIVPGDGC
jgi:hypothetical protein